MTNIEINRDAVEAAIAKLRRERGSAVLDGKKFDSGKITAAEADLAAFEDAEAARIARQRELCGDEHSQRRSRRQSDLCQRRTGEVGCLVSVRD